MSSTHEEHILRNLPPAQLPADETKCPICMDKWQIPNQPLNEVVKTKRCGHIFHKACLAAWINAGDGHESCPMCRSHLWSPTSEVIIKTVDDNIKLIVNSALCPDIGLSRRLTFADSAEQFGVLPTLHSMFLPDSTAFLESLGMPERPRISRSAIDCRMLTLILDYYGEPYAGTPHLTPSQITRLVQGRHGLYQASYRTWNELECLLNPNYPPTSFYFPMRAYFTNRHRLDVPCEYFAIECSPDGTMRTANALIPTLSGWLMTSEFGPHISLGILQGSPWITVDFSLGEAAIEFSVHQDRRENKVTLRNRRGWAMAFKFSYSQESQDPEDNFSPSLFGR